MNQKRGQITLFVILGIIVLLLTSISFWFIEQRSTIQQRDIPNDIVQVVTFVEDCLQEYGTRAVRILGQQGGYIQLPRNIDQNPWGYIERLPDSGIKEPYWYYDGELLYPANLQVLEKQINDYINANLHNCIRNFSAFTDKFEIKEATNPQNALNKIKTTTELTNNDVVVKLSYPLKIRSKGVESTTEYSDFIVHVPARVKKAYELAVQIMNKENQDNFLENETINLMVVDKKIPFSDMAFKCGKMSWNLDGADSISENLKETLFWNMPRIRVKDTNHAPFKSDIKEYQKYDRYDNMDLSGNRYIPFEMERLKIPDNLPPDMYEYKHLYWEVIPAQKKNEYKDMQVNINYDRSWPVEINARPSKNRKLASNAGKGYQKYLSFLCMNIYHFTYDVAFPAEINIFDPKAFNNEGYNFRFMTPVLIDHNKPNRQSSLKIGFSTRERSEEFCDQLDYSKEYRLQARDNIDNSPIKDANFTFACGRYECPLATATVDNLYMPSVYLPKNCRPGTIIGEAPDYYKAEAVITPTDPMLVKLAPLKPLTLTISRRKSTEIEKNTLPDSAQEVTVQLYSEQLDYNWIVVVNLTHTISESTRGHVELPAIDTSYDINIMLSQPDALGQKIVVGGYKNENWTIKAADLLKSNDLLLSVYEKAPFPATEKDQIAIFADLDKQEIKDKLLPVLRK
ncbi:TPA: hypothetical protein HA246_07335 [Candidatus Woesearchaeota archaeon]|nr:hypothetical protein [Candidatus Woesearchaeota archaeon]